MTVYVLYECMSGSPAKELLGIYSDMNLALAKKAKLEKECEYPEYYEYFIDQNILNPE